jgi:heat-inducible transcriptional repressor
MHIQELNSRSRAIFRQVVELYLSTGAPVGSRTISKIPAVQLSPASVRNVLADLEESGLLYAPHTSAGRMPTEIGLRLFVDGLLQIGDISSEERANIEAHCQASGRSMEEVLTEATSTLSGLSHCAGVVLVPKLSAPLRHIEFLAMGRDRGLVVLVFENGLVENRVIDLPPGLPPSALTAAGNYVNTRLQGRTIDEAIALIEKEVSSHRTELDQLTAGLVKEGLATWSGETGSGDEGTLIVRGRATLLEEPSALENLERIRQLFDDLESKREMMRLLNLASQGEGMRIYIGAESELFSLSGSSVVVSSYANKAGRLIGAIGVIGPTRLNYARVIPMVDYTAKMIGRLL